ncbi:MAG TPA: hypothetical protein VMU59_10475 [Caulobacteraceae bacterium]|nr:hypothetical protein [Caulobacteraceae bacterium]
MDGGRLPDDHPWAIVARGGAVALTLAVIAASVGPVQWLPRLLYSNNLEHFAAFYVLALAFAAARYRTSLRRVLVDIAGLATALEVARWLLPGPRMGNFNHWIADLGGILAFGAPVVVVAFRRGFRHAAPLDRDA